MYGKLFVVRNKDIVTNRSMEFHRTRNRKNLPKLQAYRFRQKKAGFLLGFMLVKKTALCMFSILRKKLCCR